MLCIDTEITHSIDERECTFFSSAHGTVMKIDHILCHKENPSKKFEDVVKSICLQINI